MLKLPLPENLVRFAYKFIDLEASSATAEIDMRTHEYGFVMSRLAILSQAKPKGALIDIGCTARVNPIPAFMCDLGWWVIGLDIREYQYQHPLFVYMKTDIVTMPIADIQADAIVLLSTLEHLGMAGRYGIKDNLNPADKMAIDNCYSLLKPDGVLLLTVPYVDNGSYYIRDNMRVYDHERLVYLFNEKYWHKKSCWVVGDGDDKTMLMEVSKIA